MGKKSTLLWLDDSRNPLTDDWLVFSPISQPFETIWVKSYDEFTAWITENGLPDAICFDNDIEDFSGINGTELEGKDCAKWLVEYCLDNKLNIPKWNCQSSNPNAKDFINGLLLSFIKNVR